MALLSFNQLYQLADAVQEPLGVAVAGGADRTVLEALRVACDRGWVKPFVVGPEAGMRQIAGEYTIPLHGFTLIDAAEPGPAAVALVHAGQAQLLMKGQIPTPALMKAILDPKKGLRDNWVISQIVLMEINPAGRRFLLTDTGICIQPTVEQMSDFLRSTVKVAHLLGEECPRVAVMAASETVTKSMPETLAAAEIQQRGEKGKFPGCVVRGPLSFDLAYSPEAAEKKKIGDADFGAADIMLFPNLVSANLTVKAIMYTADCQFGGVLCGASCPVVFMSRADTTATRLNSLALAIQLASCPTENTVY
jgi:phosphate butyryltransferase